ncbi:MAG: hypothetical protein IVW56_06525 [Candidatus Binataceae bacterium]|nr:hypothetical protein [Candidatus Binataceae bacterium]
MIDAQPRFPFPSRKPRRLRAIALFGVCGLALALGPCGIAGRAMAADAAAVPNSATPAVAPVNDTIYSFGDTGSDDGAVPNGSLTWDGTALFGRTTTTVQHHDGVIFEINSDGTGYDVLHRFGGKPNDGADPRHDAMTLVGGLLYGTTLKGGDRNDGTIFSIATDGTNYSVRHNFHAPFGAMPYSCLVDLSDILYGMTAAGGISHGTMYQINPDGTGYSRNFSFRASGGSDPHGALATDGANLYGMTRKGGARGLGVIFSINPGGGEHTVLHNFRGGDGDGASTDHGNVTIAGSTMYGMTTMGGAKRAGVIFSMGLDGSGFTILHSFGTRPTSQPFNPGVCKNLLHCDGRNPYGSLLINGPDLYGTTGKGGSFGGGTVFHIAIDGSGYAVLHSFSGKPDGKKPIDNVVLINQTLYGMTSAGGAHNQGAIFAVPVAGD